jgi:hypothetical protein
MSTLSTELKQQADQAAVSAMRSGANDEALISALVDRTLYGAELAAQKRLEDFRQGIKPSTMAFILAHPMESLAGVAVGLAIVFCSGMAVVYGGGSAIEATSTTRSK